MKSIDSKLKKLQAVLAKTKKNKGNILAADKKFKRNEK